MIYLEKKGLNSESLQVAVAQLKYSHQENLKCILGSCVSIVLFSSEIPNNFASMSHYLLAILAPETPRNIFDENKYGNILIEKQIENTLVSIDKSNIKAMIFGGAQIKTYMRAKIIANIGEKNIELAYKKLEYHKIEVVASDTGGDTSRFIEFNPRSKSAIVRRLKNNKIFSYNFHK